jgi:hypothetical protein
VPENKARAELASAYLELPRRVDRFFLAGSESVMGARTNDTTPEPVAARLCEVAS